jgi:membrane protease YdiL (CAAX protease family)
VFFALSLFAWVIWVPQAAQRLGAPVWAPSLKSPLNVLTVWSPGLAAMLIVWRMSGGPGVAALFRPLASWRVPVRWYLLALMLEPAKWLVAFWIDRLAGQSYEMGPTLLAQTFGSAAAFMIPVAIVFTLPNALGEELGWRAFALPRLQERHGALAASVILGLFWGIWHIPMWAAFRSSEPDWLPILLMVINMIPVAIVLTWLFNRTGGSLLIVCLYHASIANKGYLLPRLPTLTEAALMWLVAVLVVMAGGVPRFAAQRAEDRSS